MIKAIIFDKDGTLIDFDSLWVEVSVNAINKILGELKREDIPLEEVLASIGIENGITDMDGLLCKGTYEQMALAINEVFKKYGCNMSDKEIVRIVIDAYNLNVDSGEVKPTCANLKEVLEKLTDRGIKLAIVTTDNAEITHICLEKLGIEDLFYKVYSDDGKTPAKPDPYCAFSFSELIGAEKDEIIMVGDTMTDVRFARNAGISVFAVGSTEERRERLRPYADFVASDISHIFEYIGEDR